MNIEVDIKDRSLEEEVRKEIGLILYDKEIYSLGKAADFAGVSKLKFMELMRMKNIHIKYSIEDVKQDLNNIQYLMNDR